MRKGVNSKALSLSLTILSGKHFALVTRLYSMRLMICITLMLALLSAGSHAREPMISIEELVPVELATVAMDPVSGTPVVVLREAGTGDVVLIYIGVEEAIAIIRSLEAVQTPRPMTHDTAAALIGAMGGKLERVMVDALVDNAYYGVLDVRLDDDPNTPVYIDTRPSDGLALAVRTGASILVAPEVLTATRGREFEGLAEHNQVTALGITVALATDEARASFGLPDEPGLLVTRSVGEALAKGVDAGALILTVNGVVPNNPLEFLELVQETGTDEAAVIRFWHQGQTHQVEIGTDIPRQGPRTRPMTPMPSA